MSHEKRMHMIDEQGAGGFALEEGHKLDSSAVEKIQETVDVSEIVAKYDKESVYRSFKGWLDIFIKILCIAFSAFHLYTAATTPFAPQIQRAVHLGFVLTLIYLLYPARATGNMNKLAWYDAILAIAGAVVCGYIVWQYDIIVLDAGPATELDFIMGCASILLVLEATRRIVGIPITLVAVVFLLYAKFGNLIPGMLGHPGFSVQRIVSHMYLTTEGLFGMPLGVSASFVFLFILFGAFLHSTGLGKFFIDLALAAAGRYVGGPAKVAVLASGFFGTISGSSVANTVSTGTFTIPLMKSVGYRGAFAGAVEAASSTGGQIMPPIMGAAAFIMAQFLGVGYVEIAKAALVPALLYYLAVGFMVHMEAKRLGLKGIPKERLPRTWAVLRQGGYLLIPIIVLIYMLMQGYTPLKAAYYCIVTTVVISLVAENWKTWHGARYSNENVMSALAQTNFLSLKGVLQAMENGGRLALGVAAACACTGFVIGVVTLTGLGLKLANAILTISADSFALTLLLTMLASIVLGMGLPTTANYIIMASLTAPILVQLASGIVVHGVALAVPLIAAHLYCFYFGILADDTPPVGLAAYAAAAIADTSPIATGIQGFLYDIRTAILPLMFIFNHDIILWGVDSVPEGIFLFFMTVLGCMSFASLTQGWFIAKNTLPDALLLACSTIIMLYPALLTGFFLPHDQRYWGYLIGIGIMGLLAYMQHARTTQTTEAAA